MCIANEMAIVAQKANTERRFSRQLLYTVTVGSKTPVLKLYKL